MVRDGDEPMDTLESMPRERVADIAYRALRLLDGDSDADDVDAAWRAEIARRIDDIDRGHVTTVSHDDTVAIARAALAARQR